MDRQARREKTGRVDDLHLKYLEASFEGFRRSAHSLMIISGGAVAALLGLFPVLLPGGVGMSNAASAMKWPVAWFLVAVIMAVVAQLMFSLSAHSAAWGKVASERRFRTAGIVLLTVGTATFGMGAFAAVDVVGDPSLRTELQRP